MSEQPGHTPQQPEEPVQSPQEQREQERRNQQANWFLGGTLFVICAAAGNAISTATANRVFLVAGFAVGILAAWAVNRFAK